MSEPKWTRGPWGIHRIRHNYYIGRPKGERVLPDGLDDVVVSMDSRELTDEAEARIEANVNLIAAAPELYAELEKVDPTNPVLAKARGEESE